VSESEKPLAVSGTVIVGISFVVTAALEKGDSALHLPT
jgi:hypothetical protein